MTRHRLALIDVFSSIPDFRQSKGKRHPLKAILAMAAAAMLCGYRSYSAIAEWGRNYGADLAKALGCTQRKTPCASTLHTIFSNIDKQITQRKIAEAILDGRGDYQMIVKENQAELLNWIRSLFDEPIWLRESPDEVETIDIGHGRVEVRRLRASSALSGGDFWPGMEQGFEIRRVVIKKKSARRVERWFME